MTGKDLQCKMKDIQITQKELAKELCVSEGAVSLWLSDQRKIPTSIEKLFCLCYNFDFKPCAGVSGGDLHPDLFNMDEIA